MDVAEIAVREETTLDEVVSRIRTGEFYDDYDWASGPALRALDRALAVQDAVGVLFSTHPS